MTEYIEKHIVKYSCGCRHEIGLAENDIFWKPTGNENNCEEHGSRI